MLVINSIEKTRLSADSYSYSGTGVAWKARLVLFLGFALMAGGLAGSVVSLHPSVLSVGFHGDLSSTVKWSSLTRDAPGRVGAQICGTRVHSTNAVFRHRERCSEWTDHAELSRTMGIAEHGG